MPQTPRFERESFFQASAADTSGADVARGLAQALNQFSGIAQATGNEINRVRVETIKIGVQASKTDMEEQIDLAKGLYADDVESFNEFVNGSFKGMNSAMPEDQRGPFQSAVSGKYKTALTEVTLGQHQRFKNEGLVISDERQKQATTNGAIAARAGNTQGIKEARKQLNESLSPQLYTKKQIKAAKVSFDKEMTEQSVIGTALNIADDKGIIAAFTEIQIFEEKGMNGVSPDETTRIANLARGVLNTRISTENKKQVISDKATKDWQKANYESFMVDASGAAKTPKVQETVLGEAKKALESRRINSVQFKAIRDEINAPDGVNNLSAVEEIQHLILDNVVEKSEVDDVIALYRVNGNLNSDAAFELREKNQKRSGLPPTPFELQTKQSFDFLKLSLVGTIDLTGLDLAKGQRFARAFQEYQQRIEESALLGEEGQTPSAIAADMVPRYLAKDITSKSLPRTRHGDKNSIDGLDDAEIGAQDDFDKGLLTEPEYIRELDLIEQAREIIEANATIKEVGGIKS